MQAVNSEKRAKRDHRADGAALILLLVTLSVYWQVGTHAFISLDDYPYVTRNSHVTTGLNLSAISWAFTTLHESNWHPLTWLSHMTDCTLFGLNPRHHHLMNLLFHLGNTLILYLFLKRWTGAPWRSILVAAAFALHPLHVESVAWVAERKDLLCTLFWLLALYAYAGYSEHRSLSRYLLSLFLFVLGLMSKPMIVTFPFLLVLLDYWPLGGVHQQNQGTVRQRLVEKVPFFALSAASCVITYYAQHKGGALTTATPFAIRAGNAALAYVAYIRKLFWPVDLAPFYPFPETVPLWGVTGAVAALLAATAAVLLTMRQRPYLAVGWFWYLGTLVPVIGLVKVGSQAMADRYTYFPSIGLFIVIFWGMEPLVSERAYARRLAAAMAFTALTALAATAYVQIGYWKDVVKLFQHSLRVTGVNFYGNNILWTAQADNRKEEHFRTGLKAARGGDLEPAVREFTEVLAIDPDDIQARFNLGYAFQMQGDCLRAAEQYRRILQMNPDHAGALQNLKECREGVPQR